MSTLLSSIKSRTTTLIFSFVVLPTPIDVVIPVSAKFFSPLVCTKRLTGFTKSSNPIELFILYDKF